VDLSLNQLIKIARRWWWLIILAPLIGGASAYLSADRQTPLYSASATIQVNPPQNQNTVDLTALNGAQRLAETYRQLIRTRVVLEPLVESLDLPYTVSTLQGKVSTSTVSNTQLIKISVSDPSPEQAAYLANAIADRFLAYNAEEQAKRSGPYLDQINQQLTSTQQQIATVQAEISAIEASDTPNSAENASRRTDLNQQLTQLQTSYSDALNTANQVTLDQAAQQTQVTIADRAYPPSVPYAPRTKLYTVLGAFVGFCIAIGGVALLEYLDNTMKPGLDFQRMFNTPLLAVVGLVQNIKPGREQLFLLEQPNSTSSEAVRLLRTNLEFAAASKPIASLAVTSAGPGEGKTTVTANLAVSMAQAGFTTVIVDADLRRPTLHHVFGIRNDRGLTSLLTRPDQSWQWAAVSTISPNLMVIPSGPVPPNPSDLLSSDALGSLVEKLTQHADIVLFDTPPILAVSDPLVIATHVDSVMMVSRAGRTRIDAAKRAVESLPRENVRLVGMVLNQQSGRNNDGYYYYYDYSGYYGTSEPGKPATPPAVGQSSSQSSA
jgi:capsular exopolysaccharide synthesis family protein